MENKKITLVLILVIFISVVIFFFGTRRQEKIANLDREPLPQSKNITPEEETYCSMRTINKAIDVTSIDVANKKGFKLFTNKRDRYQFEYPSNTLSVDGTEFIDSGNGIFWSASIGYLDALGSFGDVTAYCGNLENAISAVGRRSKLTFSNRVNKKVGQMDAVSMDWRDDQKATGGMVFVPMNENVTLIFGGPGEADNDRPIFDKIVQSLKFL